MKTSKSFLIVFLLFAFATSVGTAQTFYNNGITVKLENTLLYVGGTLDNNSGTLNIQNAGNLSQLVVTGDFINSDVSQGDGVYRIHGDWLNNGTFVASTSTVFLLGGNQLLGGSVSTSFNDLILQGSGQKTQTVDQYCSGILDLTSVELKTETNGFYMENNDPAAINRTTGFVSSLDGGFLSRNTNSSGTYLFPVGSSAGTTRYRPVEITPENTTANTYTVRMANVDATSEGFDRALLGTGICEINPLFYHQIDRSAGTAGVDLSIYFDIASDGSFEGISDWNISPNQWELISGSMTATGTPLDLASISSWTDFSQPAYGLYISTPNVMAGGNTPICEGEDINLTETGGDAVSWSWSGPDGFSSSVQNPVITAATIDANGTFTVDVTDANGCMATSNVDVTINPTPDVPAVSTDCSGGEDNGIITVTSPAGPDYEYSIDGTTYQSETDFGPLANGSYTITVIDINTGCSTVSSTINLDCGCTNPPGLTLSQTSGDVCQTNPVTISGNTFGGSATQVSIAHDGNGSLDQTSFNSSPFEFTYTPDPLDEGNTVTITLTSDNPMGAPCNPATEIFILEIYPSPMVNAQSNSPVCEGDAIMLTENGGSATSWSWSGPDGFTSSVDNPEINDAGLADAGTYSVSITDSNGCTNSQSTTVEITSLPDPGITDPGYFCIEDDPEALSVATPGGTWSGDGIIDDGSGLFDPTLAGVGTSYVYYEVANSGCSAIDSIEINVVETADASITDPGYFCSDNAPFRLQAATPGGIWTGNGINSETGIFDPELAGNGDHEIIYTIEGNCGNADTITITVYPRADATITYAPDSLFVSDESELLTAQQDGGVWSGMAVDQESGEFFPAEAGVGSYQIFYTIEEICGDTDSVRIVVLDEPIEDLIIPDVFTPNGDGYNDTWEIQGIEAYDHIEIFVVTRWGDQVFEYNGSGASYANIESQWDGTHNGKDLPFGSYVFVVKLTDSEVVKGTVTIVR